MKETGQAGGGGIMVWSLSPLNIFFFFTSYM